MSDGATIPDIELALATIPKTIELLQAEEHETALARSIENLDARLDELRQTPFSTEGERRLLDRRIQAVIEEREGVRKRVGPARRERLRLREAYAAEASARAARIRIAELAGLMQEIATLRARLLRLSKLETRLGQCGGDALSPWLHSNLTFTLLALEQRARRFLAPL